MLSVCNILSSLPFTSRECLYVKILMSAYYLLMCSSILAGSYIRTLHLKENSFRIHPLQEEETDAVAGPQGKKGGGVRE
jgi:hypothetical protein